MTARGVDINSAIRRGPAPSWASSMELPLHHKIDGDDYILSHLSRLTVGDIKSRFDFDDNEFLGTAYALSIQVRGRPANRDKVTAEWDNRSIQAVVAHYIEALLERYGLQGFAHTIKVEFVIEFDQASSSWLYR